jgi:hypothetical protein
MFDDQNKVSTGGQTPGNLPMGEPEDIFSGSVDNDTPAIDVAPSAVDAGILQAKSPEPIMAQTKPEVSPIIPQQQFPSQGQPQPVQPVQAQPIQSQPVAMMTPPDIDLPPVPQDIQQPVTYAMKEPNFGKIIFIIFISILFLGSLLYGAWYYYTNYMVEERVGDGDGIIAEDIIDIDILPEYIEEKVEDEVISTSSEDIVESVDEIDSEVLFGDVVDTDEDGLDDLTEKELGTDERNWDTDGDLLSDSEEVNIWKTDPKNPDTDGDSYLDGQEVRAGYNPMGSGLLSEFGKEISTSTENIDIMVGVTSTEDIATSTK